MVLHFMYFVYMCNCLFQKIITDLRTSTTCLFLTLSYNFTMLTLNRAAAAAKVSFQGPLRYTGTITADNVNKTERV